MSMDSAFSAIKTISAYILLVLVLIAAWLVVSPIAYALRKTLDFLGLPEALSRFIAWLAHLSPIRLWQLGWNLLAQHMPARGTELRLVVDRRLATLERSLATFGEQVRNSATLLVGLGSSDGPSGLATEMRDLKERVAALKDDEVPYEIEPDYEKAVASEISARTAFYFLLFLAIAVVAVNGFILSEAFRGVGLTQVFLGILPASTAFALMYVLMEFAIGFGLHLTLSHSSDGNWAMRICSVVLLFIAVALVMVEIIIANLIGGSQLEASFDLTALIADQLSLARLNFMGVMGFAIGAFNILAGFLIHFISDKRTHLAARKRIVRDASAWNNLLTELPSRLKTIATDVNRAQGSLEAYLDKLGGRADSITGAVDSVGKERKAVDAALKRADLRNWPQWLGSDDGDAQQSFWISIGLAVLTLIAGYAFVISFASEIAVGLADPSPGLAIFGAIGAALGFYILGFFLLSKIQLSEDPHNRVMPLRIADAEKVLASVSIVVAILAVFGFSLYAHGWSGLAAAALNSLLAAALVWLGSQWDRFWRGLSSGGIGLLSIITAVAALAIGLLLHIVGWPLIAIGKVVLLILSFLEMPFAKLLAIIDRRRGSAQGASA